MKYLGPPQSGSQAGTTASHNRAGQYFRNRRTPVSPTRTPKQSQARARFGASSALWQSLSAADQNAWTAFAMSYPVVDSLGQSVVLTGQQYFIGIQSQLQHLGQPPMLAIPSNTTLIAVDTPQLYLDDSGTVIGSVASIAPGDFNKLSLSPVLSNGVSFNKQFSLFGIMTSASLVVDVSEVYAAQYGAPIIGKKIFAAIAEVNSSGMSSNPVIIQSGVVAAPVAAAPVATNVVTGTVVSTGPGAGTDTVWLFEQDPATGAYDATLMQAQVAGVATFAGVTIGAKVFTRTTIAGVWGKRSNILTVT